MTEPMHIISLGAGVQSSTMALMAAHGEITPMPDAAIFADTQDEPAKVYDYLNWLETKLPYPVYRVSAGSLMDVQLTQRVSAKTGNTYFRNMIPAFVAKPGGGRAILARRCTAEFKVREIIKKARQLLGRKAMKAWQQSNPEAWSTWSAFDRLNKAKKKAAPFPFAAFRTLQNAAPVVQWIGISLDEMKRMKEGQTAWSKSRFPLIERRLTRNDCLVWMESNGYPEPPRSACRKCPFHDDAEWLRQKTETPDDFAESVAYDYALRESLATATGSARLQGLVYLHDSLMPLDQVDFTAPRETAGQRMFGFADECEGMCGV